MKRLIVLMLVVLACLVAGASGRGALPHGQVKVPTVGANVVADYARLHAAGLKVSIPAGVSIDPLARPRRWRVRPKPGTLVATGSTVTLAASCCAPAARRRSPSGRLPRYVVPSTVGLGVSDAYAWAASKSLFFIAHLGPLHGGDAPGLFGNYRITGQSPASGSTIALGIRSGTTKHPHLRPTPITVHGEQGPPTPCTPPIGARIVAQSPQVVITEQLRPPYGYAWLTQWWGCVRGVGQRRLLTASQTNGDYGGPYLHAVVVAGLFAALQFENQGGKYAPTPCGARVEVYDLSTGTGQHAFGGCGTLDSLQLNSSGFAAVHQTTDPPRRPTLDDIACPSVSMCVAVDSMSNVVTSTNPGGGRDAWTVANLNPPHVLSGVSCLSTGFCAAVGGSSVYTSTNPLSGSAAWTGGPADNPMSIALTRVSCPSVSLCVAAMPDGRAGATTNPAGTPSTWSAFTVDPSHNDDLRAMSCPSVSLCVTGDNGSIITSTNPSASTNTWIATPVDHSRYPLISAVSCPTTSFCVAVDGSGNAITSTNPTGGASAWTVTPIDSHTSFGFGLTGISCPTPSFCAAVDGSGNVFTSTNPTGGPTAWNTTRIDTNQPSAISCPSVSLCVAVDFNGQIITSTDPSSTSPTWTSALVDAPDCALTTPCIPEQIYVHDNHGTRLVDSAPPGSGTALSNLTFTGDTLTWTHDGNPQQATLS